MHNGVVAKVEVQTNDYKKNIVVGVSLAAGLIVSLTALQLLLPEKYRACSLMPGFCKKADPTPLQPLEKLGREYSSGGKFDLTSSR
jgi:hypothetical protein